MSLPPKQKKSQPAWLDVGVFAFVLGFLCFSVQTLLGSNVKPPVTKSVAEVAATVPAPETQKRRPASPSPAVKAGGSTEVLKLPCLTQATRSFSTEARMLQIHAPACGEDLKRLDTWKGSNESSGEEILVFVNSKEKTLSTSYFALRDGVNKIVFTHELGKGPAKIQTIEVSKDAKAE